MTLAFEVELAAAGQRDATGEASGIRPGGSRGGDRRAEGGGQGKCREQPDDGDPDGGREPGSASVWELMRE